MHRRAKTPDRSGAYAVTVRQPAEAAGIAGGLRFDGIYGYRCCWQVALFFFGSSPAADTFTLNITSFVSGKIDHGHFEIGTKKVSRCPGKINVPDSRGGAVLVARLRSALFDHTVL